MVEILTALTTKKKDYRGIKKLGFINNDEPVTSTRCSSDSLPWDSAIRALFEDRS